MEGCNSILFNDAKAVINITFVDLTVESLYFLNIFSQRSSLNF